MQKAELGPSSCTLTSKDSRNSIERMRVLGGFGGEFAIAENET